MARFFSLKNCAKISATGAVNWLLAAHFGLRWKPSYGTLLTKPYQGKKPRAPELRPCCITLKPRNPKSSAAGRPSETGRHCLIKLIFEIQRAEFVTDLGSCRLPFLRMRFLNWFGDGFDDMVFLCIVIWPVHWIFEALFEYLCTVWYVEEWTHTSSEQIKGHRERLNGVRN